MEPKGYFNLSTFILRDKLKFAVYTLFNILIIASDNLITVCEVTFMSFIKYY